MADRVELRFRRAIRELIPSEASVVTAVSGGGDSVALLHLLCRSVRSDQPRIAVAHLDHGLRRGSRTDRRFVEELAAQLGVACHAERRDVAAARRRDESPEEAARRVRRGFLLDVARATGSQFVATGHTLDDQAETVLMRLVRGAGTTALAGMAAAGPQPFVRPLLGIESAELRDWLDRHDLPYREDPTNRSLRFDRNRVRHRVLPVLVEQLNPQAAKHLVKAAEGLRDDARYLDQLARQLADRLVGSHRRGTVSITAAELAAADPVLGKRVVRLALLEAGADPRRVVSRHVVAVLALAGGHGGGEIHLPGRLRARRLGRRILLESRKP